MPTVFTHAFVGYIGSRFLGRHEFGSRFIWLSLILPILPDADVIAFVFGIPYADFWGHRGFSHSLFFAAILAIVVVMIFFKALKPGDKIWFGLVAYFTLITASHGLLDMLTNGGLGIAILSPFDNARYFFPWTPVAVSPIGLSAFLSAWGLRVLVSEIIWIWIPLSVIYIGFKIRRKRL